MFAAHTSRVGMYTKEERSSGKNHTFDNGGMPYGSYFYGKPTNIISQYSFIYIGGQMFES